MARSVWFFGAGASAPFGIPTMQQMVEEFQRELGSKGSDDEKTLYARISDFLKSTLGRPVDLEVVFSVVDSVVNWSPDRMGIAALYQAFQTFRSRLGTTLELNAVRGFEPPSRSEAEHALSLRRRFEEFVRVKCEIPEKSIASIETAFGGLFDTMTIN